MLVCSLFWMIKHLITINEKVTDFFSKVTAFYIEVIVAYSVVCEFYN